MCMLSRNVYQAMCLLGLAETGLVTDMTAFCCLAACGPSSSSSSSSSASGSWASPGYPSLEECVKRGPTNPLAAGSRVYSRGSGPQDAVGDPWGWGPLGAGVGLGGLGMLGMMEGGGYMGGGGPPAVTDGVKEALKIVFSKEGSYAQVRDRDQMQGLSRNEVNIGLEICPVGQQDVLYTAVLPKQ